MIIALNCVGVSISWSCRGHDALHVAACKGNIPVQVNALCCVVAGKPSGSREAVSVLVGRAAVVRLYH